MYSGMGVAMNCNKRFPHLCKYAAHKFVFTLVAMNSLSCVASHLPGSIPIGLTF